MIAFSVFISVVGVGFIFASWLFSGTVQIEQSLNEPPKILEIVVDGGNLSKYNYPDIGEGGIDVPAELPVRIECETTISRVRARFTLNLDGVAHESVACSFEVRVAAEPRGAHPAKLLMRAQDDGRILDEEPFAVRPVERRDAIRVTHLVPIDVEDAPPAPTGLRAPEQVRAWGKLWLTDAPKKSADLVVLVFVGRVGGSGDLELAVDRAALSNGTLEPNLASLVPYRTFGPGGGVYYFRTPNAVTIGTAIDGGKLFRLVAAVMTREASSRFVAEHVQVVESTSGKAFTVQWKPATTTALGNLAFRGLVSEDLRVIREGGVGARPAGRVNLGTPQAPAPTGLPATE